MTVRVAFYRLLNTLPVRVVEHLIRELIRLLIPVEGLYHVERQRGHLRRIGL